MNLPQTSATHAANDEQLIDASKVLWPRWAAWTLGFALTIGWLVLILMVAADAVVFVVPLAVILGPQGIGALRAWQAGRALGDRLDAARHAGRMHAKVQFRERSGMQTLLSDRTTDLIVADGVVRIGPNTWPATYVSVERPGGVLQRGIGLNTPHGRVFVTCAPAKDPAMYWGFLLDRPVADTLAAVLTAHAAPPPVVATPAGWYPDPAGSGRQRWWDGAGWSDRLS